MIGDDSLSVPIKGAELRHLDRHRCDGIDDLKPFSPTDAAIVT